MYVPSILALKIKYAQLYSAYRTNYMYNALLCKTKSKSGEYSFQVIDICFIKNSSKVRGQRLGQRFNAMHGSLLTFWRFTNLIIIIIIIIIVKCHQHLVHFYGFTVA